MRKRVTRSGGGKDRIDVRDLLAEGRRNQTDDLPALVRRVLADPRELGSVVRSMALEQAALAARAAWVVRRVAEREPSRLRVHQGFLVTEPISSVHWEVRAELCHVLPRLALTRRQEDAALAFLRGCGSDPSRIVQAWALDALVRTAEKQGSLESLVEPLLLRGLMSPYPSVRARARRLIAQGQRSQGRKATRKA